MQLKLDFEPGITEQFKTLKQCVAAVVYNSRAGLGGCAIACDVSPSTLSKMLNEQEDPENKRHLPMDFLDPIIAVTSDRRPLYWLAAKHAPSDSTRLDAAVALVETLAPQLLAAVSIIKGSKK